MTDVPMPPENQTAATNITNTAPETFGPGFELTRITKTIISVLSLIVAVGVPLLSYTTGFLPEKVAFIISAIVGVSGSVLHYLAPNTTANPVVAQTQSVRLK